VALIELRVDADETMRWLSLLQAERWPRALAQAAKELSKEANLRFRQTTKTWRHQPVFVNKVEIQADGFTVTAGTTDTIYGYLDQGTGLYGPRARKYAIRPHGNYPLRFQSGYNAKTISSSAVAARGSYASAGPVQRARGGGAFGPVVYAREVMHPGIKPRNFTPAILAHLGAKTEEILDKQISKAMKG